MGEAEEEAALVARLREHVVEAVQLSEKPLALKEGFRQVGQYLEGLKTVLDALPPSHGEGEQRRRRRGLEELEEELTLTAKLMRGAAGKSRFQLVVTGRAVGQKLEDVTRGLGRKLSGALGGISEAAQLGLQMQQAELGPDPAEAAILHDLDQAMRENKSTGDVAGKGSFLRQLCQMSNLPMDKGALLQEAEELKKGTLVGDSGDPELGDLAMYVVSLLEVGASGLPGSAPSNSHDDEGKKNHKVNSEVEKSSAESAANPPLPSFSCALTKELMEDPVRIETGECFERTAIEQWFAAGHKTNPLTKKALKSLTLTPDTALRESIEEWHKGNTVLQIQATRPKLESSTDLDVETGLLEIFKLCEKRPLNRFWIAAEGLLPPIVNVLKSSSRNLRRKALFTLTSLATDNEENREAISDAGAIPLAVRSLARDSGESKQGVALLMELSKSTRVCEEIGKAQGSILLLVTMVKSDNANAAKDARTVLDQLARSDQNVVQMAEANHFGPLAERLSSGMEMTKTVMASALSRMALTDQSKAALAQEGAIAPLVSMIAGGRLEAKAAALGALQNLSTLAANRDPLISAGVLPPLLQLLFSVTSVVMSLKEGAAATVANLAVAGKEGGADQSNADEGNILESEETIYQLLSLLNLAGSVIQVHLLRALHGMASPPGAIDVRTRIRVGGAVSILMPFLEGQTEQQGSGLRLGAIQLLQVLCSDGAGKEVAENLLDGQAVGLKALVRLLGEKESPADRASAAGVLAGLPSSDEKLTSALLKENGLPLLVAMLGARTVAGAKKDAVQEGATAALVRFTLPSNVGLQQTFAKAGAIPLLVSALSSGTSATKRSAAECLGNLAQSSNSLSRPPTKAKGGGCCFTPPQPEICDVHGGECDVETTFCLLEAEAVTPLVNALGDRSPETAAEALAALSTLLFDQGRWEMGVKLIHNAGGFLLVVAQLTDGTERAKVKGVWMLEKLFRIDEYKFEYGAKAQGALIELTQKGSAECRPVAAKILSHLEILHNQSSYF
eukprot:TRINITY_DN578_c0_g2_i1.p1 TRINITY_DN578_c0_g2~~TRINITY_DN578_c0_g2_i1.p1  ORF type:complete len:1019 (+),score=231.15 TRINITY_DN578_c0_g2_i1:889-3945(+)